MNKSVCFSVIAFGSQKSKEKIFKKKSILTRGKEKLRMQEEESAFPRLPP